MDGDLAARQVGDPGSRARRLIEHLRSGVPLPPDEPPLTAGRAGLLAHTGDLLDIVEQRGSRAMALQANYGDGKTHALRAIWHLASQRNFVVSSVAVTAETPLSRLDLVYPRLIADTYLPGAAQPGIERLVAGIEADGPEADSLLRFAEDHLHPKLHAVLQSLLRGSSTEAVEPLLRDLARVDMGAAEVKRIYRTNFGRPLRLTSFARTRDVREYFRLVDFLVRLRGYAGWVLLIDEVELIGRLGRGARAKALATIGQLAGDALGCSHLLPVFAVASNFYGDVLDRRHDRTAGPDWLRARGDEEAAQACAQGIAALDDARRLIALTPAHWTGMMQTLLDAHQTAYGWSAGVTAAELWQQMLAVAPETGTKLRTRLRIGIQWLDLMLQNEGRAPQVRLARVAEVPLAEDPGWNEPAAEPPAASDEVAAGVEPPLEGGTPPEGSA